MNAIALGMNLFLAVLLLAALAMGWRLERRLRGVRESQALFVKAVSDLDQATGRAHAGLAELREATDEAIDLLGGRIVRAKEAADRLDRALDEAEAVLARRPEPAQPAAPAPRREAIAPTDLRGLLELAERAQARIAAQPHPQPPLQASPAARPAPQPERRAPLSAAWPVLDDDLFVGGGLR
jgi:hypothetical protein